MNRFRGRKEKNNFIIYLGLFLISISFSIKYLYEKDLINKDTLIDNIINDKYDLYKNNSLDVKFLLKYALNIDLKEEVPVIKEEDIHKDIEISSAPIVYIYNTHQEEKYQNMFKETFNISSSVLTASKILKEYLEEYGINALVEVDSVSDKLHSLNWKYGYSYRVSRMMMESAIKDNPSLKYFIDIHRDSSKYEKTTTKIDGEDYARVLFVVGLDNENYEPNLELAENLRKRIDAYNSDLCRGIMKKSGAKVNGVYNQDFSEKVMLIEVGGQYNNIREVNNTLKALAKILKEYIEDDNHD